MTFYYNEKGNNMRIISTLFIAIYIIISSIGNVFAAQVDPILALALPIDRTADGDTTPCFNIKIQPVILNGQQEPLCPNYGLLTIVAVDSLTGNKIPNLSYTWYGESVYNLSTEDTSFIAIIPHWFNHLYEVHLSVTDTINGCTATATYTLDVRDTLAPVVQDGVLENRKVFPTSEGKYYIPDFTSLLTYETVSDNCCSFAMLTINQYPTAGTEFSETTTVTITLSGPCGDENQYFVQVEPWALDTICFPNTSCSGYSNATLGINHVPIGFSCTFQNSTRLSDVHEGSLAIENTIIFDFCQIGVWPLQVTDLYGNTVEYSVTIRESINYPVFGMNEILVTQPTSSTSFGQIIIDTVAGFSYTLKNAQQQIVSGNNLPEGIYTLTKTSLVTGCATDTVISIVVEAVGSDGQPCPGAPTVTDIDGNVYNTVQIGAQCWMKENLRVTHYADGSNIPDGDCSSITTTTTDPYYYINTNLDAATYGYYYNWLAAMHGAASSNANPSNVQGVCPTGWHLPSDAEWSQLTNYVSGQSEYTCGGNSNNIAKALASETGWWDNSDECTPGDQSIFANNATGFSAVPADNCYGPTFEFAGATSFWSSTEDGPDHARTRYMSYTIAAVPQSYSNKYNGRSVRCLRDPNGSGSDTTQTQPSVTTEEASNITATSATLNGSISNPDNVTITAQGFQWKATQGGSYTTISVTGTTMSYNLTGLTANMSYIYRAFATTAEGTSYGEEVLFTTPCVNIYKSFSDTACNSYQWNDRVYTISGDYVQIFNSANGCDSIVTLHLTLWHDTATEWSDTACNVYTWNESTYTETGDYIQHFQTVHDCDSMVTLHLTIPESTSGDTSAVVCGSFDWHEHLNITQSCDNLTHTFPGGNAAGCDSTVTLHLTIHHSYDSTLFVSVLENDLPYYFNGLSLFESGTYTYTLSTVGGCDSILTVNLTVIHNVMAVMDSLACESELPIIWNGIEFNTAGTKTAVLTASTGADSILVMNLYAFPATSGDTTAIACDSFDWYEYTGITQSGEYTHIFEGGSVYGCDSTVTLHITVIPIPEVTITGTTTIFPEDSTMLTAIGADNYIWSTGDYSAAITVNPTATTTYSVTGTDSYGCIGSASTVVSVRAVPTLNPSKLGTGLNNIELDCNELSVTLCANVVSTAEDYIVENIPYDPPYNYTDGTGITQYLSDDIWSFITDLPFTFRYYGFLYNQIVPGSNSVATFNTNKARQFCDYLIQDSIPSMNLFANTIFACYRDINLNYHGTEGGAYEGVFGEAPYRRYKLSFNNIGLFGNQHSGHMPSDDIFSSMIVLYEGTNVIDIYIRDAPNNSFMNGGNGVLGLQNRTGTKGITPPGRNTGPWTAHEEAWRFIPVADSNYTVTWYLGTDTTLATGIIVGTGDTITVFPQESTDYTALLHYTDGCGSTFTIAHTCHVTVSHENPTITVDASENEICDFGSTTLTATGADTYLWSTGDEGSSIIATPTSTTTYYVTGYSGNVCSTIDSITVIVLESVDTVITVAACESYTWNDLNYYISGSYVQHFQTVHGCDSTVTLHLTVNHSTDIVLEATVMENDLPYFFNGHPYYESGTYTDTMLTVNGCDSIIYTHLVVLPNVQTEIDSTICDNMLPFFWNGNYCVQSGDYTHILTTVYGADSIVTLHLTVNPANHTNLYQTACDSYTWRGETYTESGDYPLYLTNTAGCDSIVTLHLTLWHDTATEWSDTACNVYTWNESSYTETGDYIQHFQTVHGCDSMVTLHLTIPESTSGDTTAIACDSFDWYDQLNITQSCDNLTHTFVGGNAAGCDSTVTLHLTIHHSYDSTLFVSVLENDLPYFFNGLSLFESGMYIDTMLRVNYCDSIVTLYLTVLHNVQTEIDNAICSSQLPFIWNDSTYLQSGDYTQQFSTVSGSDSIVTLHLTVLHSDTTEFSQICCYDYTWNGITYSATGDYFQALINQYGCDSLVIMHLTVYDTVFQHFAIEACNQYIWNGINYTTSGDYTQTFVAVTGCDSIVTLHLTINPTPEVTIIGDTVICPNGAIMLTATGADNYLWSNGSTNSFIPVNQFGIYSVTGTSAAGCADTASITILVAQPPAITISGITDLCAGDTSIITAHGGTTYLWGNGSTDSVMTVSDAGIWQVIGYDENGCNSMASVNVNIWQPSISDISTSSCENYMWNDSSYTQSGDYTQYFQTVHGCDSVVTMHLTIFNDETSEFSIVTEDSSYTWNSQSYCASGDYTQTLQTVHGCDSVVTLHLTITVGIDDYDGFDFKVYPNPTNGVVNVQCTMNNAQFGEVELQVCDAYGRLLDVVETQNFASLQTAQIDLSRYAAGVYFLKAVADGETIAVRKVVKQ